MMLKRCAAAVILSTTLAFVTPAGVDAAAITTSTVTASVGDVSISSSKTTLSGDSIRFAQVLSSSYNRPVSAAEVIRLKTDFDFGLGEISLVYATAFYSGRSIDEISELRQRNMGWGEIAKLYGVKVKDLKKKNYDIVTAAQVQGVNITYIEVDDDDDHDYDDNRYKYRDYDRHDEEKYNKFDKYDKHDKHEKRDDKHDNGRGHGHKK